MNAPVLAQPSPVTACPEYERPDGIARRFSISRTSVFDLLRQGRIKSLSLKSRASNIRGPRLVNVASVRSYLESLTAN